MSLSIAEMLLYSTVKLTACKSGVSISTGTGFFSSLAENDGQSVPTIVTNKHVLQNADEIIASLHFVNDNRPSSKFVDRKIPIKPGSWVGHSASDVDLCAIFIGPILNEFNQLGTPIFFIPVTLAIVPNDDDWAFFDAIEDVVMVGCPNGISDEANSLPIVRQGITATSLANRYNNKEEFMVDMACFPGSSGSPIFIFNRNGYFDRRTNNQMIGKQRILLVGVLYAGPLITNRGQVILGQPPKVEVAAMMHLGYAVRSSALRALDDDIRKLIGGT